MAAESDPDLVSLRRDIALLESRIIALLGRLDTGESGGRWHKAAGSFGEIRAAWAAKDVPAMVAALEAHEQVIQAGVEDYAIWGDVQKTIERKRRVTATEMQRLALMHNVITEERAYELLMFVQHTLQEHIPDRVLLGKIALALEVATGGPIPSVPVGGTLR